MEPAGLRSSVSNYLGTMGYLPGRAKLLVKMCTAAADMDDGEKFAVRDVLLRWDLPFNAGGHSFVTVAR
jgi:hypothetical protein